MSVEKVIEHVKKCRIVPVLALESVDAGLRICEILNKCGLPLAEITFRSEAAEGAIREAVKRFPDMMIGAGTVLNVKDLDRAVDAGIQFGVSPGCNPTILKRAAELGIPFVPGVNTASEIECALELGAKVLKFFPAEVSGGVPMLKALLTPYKHLDIKYIPLGGLNKDNMMKYLELEDVIAIGGTWLGKRDLQVEGKWNVIEANVKEAVNLVGTAR